jgi:hypothetical protein
VRPGPDLRPPARHARAARAHLAIRYGMVALGATLIPALALAHLYEGTVADSVLVLVLWVFGWMALGVALLTFRCPQCRRPFHRGNGMLSAFTSNCVHCGIAIRPANEPRR